VPAELHLLAEHFIDTIADFFVGQELPSVELFQASVVGYSHFETG